MTVAAVDEGILQLTDFASPDPARYFLGKRRLGMQLLDLYGKLIEAGGRAGQLKVGGDADSRQLDASGVRTVKTRGAVLRAGGAERQRAGENSAGAARFQRPVAADGGGLGPQPARAGRGRAAGARPAGGPRLSAALPGAGG